jgi:hypothetical protein
MAQTNELAMTEQDQPTAVESALSAEMELSIRDEVAAVDAGPLPQTEDMALLYRVLRLRARLVSEAARIRTMADQMASAIENRVNGLDYFYGHALENIVANELSRTRAKARSVKTPFGVAGFRKLPSKLEVVDEAKAIGAGYVRQVPPPPPEVDRQMLAKHLKETGEIPAGCELREGGERFYLKSE